MSDTKKLLAIWEKQYESFGKLSDALRATVALDMADINHLQLMEMNGFKYDKAKSERLAAEGQERIDGIQRTLGILTDTDGIAVNWNSPEQVSAVLFGGTVFVEQKEDYLFHYKDAKKAPVLKQKKVEVPFPMVGMFKPLEGSETAKAGQYKTGEDVLRQLDCGAADYKKKILSLLIEHSKLDKLVSSYFRGMMKHLDADDYMHPKLNQCKAVTARLASEKPNGQNIPSENKSCWISRFKRQGRNRHV